ncbi:MAG: hypothetical protein ABJA71_06100 [Ginsengibacter sp.]
MLNENVPAKLKFNFGSGYEVTVGDMDWLSKKNGELLSLAVFNGFEIFIMLDKNLRNQQNINNLDLKIILLVAKDNKHPTLQPYIDKIKNILVGGNLLKFNEVTL